MEVFLNKKDMPKSCMECIFFDDGKPLTADNHFSCCYITKQFLWNADDLQNIRHSFCPLKPLNKSEY